MHVDGRTIDLTAAVDYRSASGAAFQLTVPIHGTVR